MISRAKRKKLLALILLVERLTKKPHARRVRIEVASCVVIRKPP